MDRQPAMRGRSGVARGPAAVRFGARPGAGRDRVLVLGPGGRGPRRPAPALELLAALPLARPFSDRPGPLLAIGPWLPLVLPAAGFLVLWRQAAHWTPVPWVRASAVSLLVLTAFLAALRAFSRGQWTATLRW